MRYNGRMRSPNKLLITLFAALLWSACGSNSGASQTSGQAELEGPVLASTWPLASLAKRLFAGNQEVRCLVPAGEDPAFWQPGEAELLAVQKAPGLLLNGAGFEPWSSTANLPQSRSLQTGQAFRSAWIEESSSGSHSHGAKGAHTHKGYDPHYWMDPLLALEQARSIGDFAIAQGWVDGSSVGDRRAALENSLRELDALWARIGKALGDQTLIANHGTYTYPAQRHRIVIEVVDQDPKQALSKASILQIAAIKKDQSPRYFLFEAQPIPALERTLKVEHGLQILILRPAESPIAGEDSAIDVWAKDLRTLVELLESDR